MSRGVTAAPGALDVQFHQLGEGSSHVREAQAAFDANKNGTIMSSARQWNMNAGMSALRYPTGSHIKELQATLADQGGLPPIQFTSRPAMGGGMKCPRLALMQPRASERPAGSKPPECARLSAPCAVACNAASGRQCSRRHALAGDRPFFHAVVRDISVIEQRFGE